jgi:hypothetical protein
VHKVPIGGWNYEDPTGYKFVSPKKDNYEALDELEKKVISYRQGHRIPFNTVREDILAQICKKNPDMFYWVDKEVKSLGKVEAILLDKAVDLYNTELIYAIKGDQDKRINTCSACAYNKNFPFENPEYNAMIFHATRGKAFDNMGHCSHYMHDNRIACLVKDELAQPAPPCCWAFKEEE